MCNIIACENNEVGIEVVNFVYAVFEIVRANGSAVVKVGDVRYARAYERVGQVVDVQIEFVDLYPVFVFVVVAEGPRCANAQACQCLSAYVAGFVIDRFFN